MTGILFVVLQFTIWNKMLVSTEKKKSEFDFFQNKPLTGKQLHSYVNVWKTGSYLLLIF